MTTIKYVISSILGVIVSTVMLTSPAFASGSNTGNPSFYSLAKGQTSITVDMTQVFFSNNLKPLPTLDFTFTPLNNNLKPISEIGTLQQTTVQSNNKDIYNVNVPNFGQAELVTLSVTANQNNNIISAVTLSNTPLLDTLPETPFAAIIPLILVVVWFFTSKRTKRVMQP